MLKKLKTKFILINMLLVGVIVSIIFFAICVMSYRSELGEIHLTLERVLQSEHSPAIGGTHEPPKEFDRNPTIGGNEKMMYVSAVSVSLGREGEILNSYEYGAGMSEELLYEAVAAVLEARGEGGFGGMREGILHDLDLIYKERVYPTGSTVAFASMEHLKVAVKNTALVAAAACLLGLFLFFWVSYFLSGVAIRPIERAWKQQKQFVADASHDLKTPLTVILANTNILRSHKSENVVSQMQWIESTEEEAAHMKSLVDRMLELAASEDMKERIVLSEISQSELTERVVLQIEPLAFEKKVDIDSLIEPDIKIKGHEESYVRLVHILVDNAIKYSNSGERVEVKLTRIKHETRLTVSNSGTIAKEDIPHIFERFYRSDKARAVGGHGLGLSIAKNLTDDLGGEIVVESVDGRTVFSVLFKEKH